MTRRAHWSSAATATAGNAGRAGTGRAAVSTCSASTSAGAVSHATHCPHPSRWGYVLTGIESPETSVIRLAVCDYMQSARVARRLLGERVARTVFEGGQFCRRPRADVAGRDGRCRSARGRRPDLCWAEGRNLFVNPAPVPRSATTSPDDPIMPRHDGRVALLRHGQFRRPRLLPDRACLGLEDDVVPAKTVYGIANHLRVPFELMESRSATAMVRERSSGSVSRLTGSTWR